MESTFQKRIFTPGLFFADIAYITKNLPAIIAALRSKRISRAFAEKIMLAATAVNECTLCARFHSEMAYKRGVDRSEVISLLNMDLSGRTSSSKEMTALIYAQHYAETSGNPSQEMKDRLINEYGKEMSTDIMLITRLIIFANLSGNTFSAFTSRMKGIRAPGSHICFELFFVSLSAPIIIPSLLYLRTKKNKFNFAASRKDKQLSDN